MQPLKNVFSLSHTYPLVSLGIPTYNGSKRIMKALNSAWAQQYPNLEIVISDNGSYDGTEELCRSLLKHHREIKYYRQKHNLGLVGNFEFVLAKATGKYFMWVADDDAIEPGVLMRYVSFLENHHEHSLVSGSLQYWKGNERAHIENGFTFEYENASLRSIGFYGKVVYGGLFHGMMRRDIGAAIPCRNVFGNDYHFVANLAFAGKVKNFDFIGYNKWLGGTSRDNKKYAKAIGESKFTGYFPHLKIAYDAFAEVMYRSPLFKQLTFFERLFTSLASAVAILYCYCFTILPFTLGGIVKRFFIRCGNASLTTYARLIRSLLATQSLSSDKHKLEL